MYYEGPVRDFPEPVLFGGELMTKDVRNDMIVAIVLIVLAIAIVIATSDYPVSDREVGVRTFPLILSAFVGGLSILLLVKSIITIRRNAQQDESEKKSLDRRTLRRIILVILGVAIYVAVVRTLGFVLTSVVFLAALPIYFGERRPLVIVAYSILGVALVYILFGVVARVPFPAGPVENLLYSLGLV